MYRRGGTGKLDRVLTTYLLTSVMYAYFDEDNNLILYDRRRVREELGITSRQERYYLRELRREGYLKRVLIKQRGKVRVYYTYSPHIRVFSMSFREFREMFSPSSSALITLIFASESVII